MSCTDSEKASVLTVLFDDDPTLGQHAENVARRTLASVDDTVSDLLVEAIADLDTEDLATRAALAAMATSNPPTRRGSCSRR